MAKESGEAFDPTGKDGSDGWTDVTGIADVWVNASVELFLKAEAAFDEGCMPSE